MALIVLLPPVDPTTATIDIVGLLGSIIGGLFGGIFGGGVPQNIATAFNGLRDSIVKSVNAVMRFAWKIAQGVAAVFEFLKVLWFNWIKRLVEELYGLIQKIYRVLTKVLKPMMDAIRRQRQQILDLYNKYIRPIIVIIEKIRHIIAILRIFHIHIFDALDAKLARLEQAVMAPILSALYRINTLGNWITFILNSRLLIFRGLFLGTLGANQNGVFSMLANVPTYGFVDLPQVNPQPQVPLTGLSFAEGSAPAAGMPAAIEPAVTDAAFAQFLACMRAPIGTIDTQQISSDLWTCLTRL